MNKKQLLLPALIVGIAAISWWRYSSSTPAAIITDSPSETPPTAAPVTAGSNRPTPPERQQPEPQADLDRLRQASVDAAEKVELAEQRLEALDSQISSLESQIIDIERRGDDPVEHAAEVEPYLRPVLVEFFDAQTQFDEAVAEKASADAALASHR